MVINTKLIPISAFYSPYDLRANILHWFWRAIITFWLVEHFQKTFAPLLIEIIIISGDNSSHRHTDNSRRICPSLLYHKGCLGYRWNRNGRCVFIRTIIILTRLPNWWLFLRFNGENITNWIEQYCIISVKFM